VSRTEIIIVLAVLLALFAWGLLLGYWR